MDSKNRLRPQYFLSRPDGELIALVPLDELPKNIIIDRVPRALDQQDTVGMVSLGTVPSRNEVYSVEVVGEGLPSNPESTLSPPINDVTGGRTKGNSEAIEKTGELSPDCSISQKPVDTDFKDSGKTSKAQDPPKKEYCSFWIRNGECDYEQQGCKFKHEMPHDPAVLSKLCLRDIPKWYRDKHHVRSLRSGEWKSPRVENNIKSSTRGRSTGNAYVQPHRRQQFAERESGTASTINVSKDSSVPAGVVQPDLLTQDPLPGYPALNPGRSMTENPSPAGDPTPTTLPDTSQTDEAPDPQPSTDPKIEASAQSQPQVSAKPTAGSQQRQTRRHKSRKSIQAPVRPASPESKIAANFSKTPGNTSSVNPNKVPSSETKAGGLPRLDIPSSRIPNAGTKSTLATVKPTTGVDKDEKKEQPSSVGGSETEKDKGSDTAKSTAVQAGLKPGAETDVFGLGLFEN